MSPNFKGILGKETKNEGQKGREGGPCSGKKIFETKARPQPEQHAEKIKA